MFPDPRLLFVRAGWVQKSPRRPRGALGTGGLPAEVGGGTSALSPSVFLYLWRQIFTEEQMGHGFGTSLLHPKVCACPLEEVFITGDRWGRPSFPSSVRGCGRDGECRVVRQGRDSAEGVKCSAFCHFCKAALIRQQRWWGRVRRQGLPRVSGCAGMVAAGCMATAG